VCSLWTRGGEEPLRYSEGVGFEVERLKTRLDQGRWVTDERVIAKRYKLRETMSVSGRRSRLAVNTTQRRSVLRQ